MPDFQRMPERVFRDGRGGQLAVGRDPVVVPAGQLGGGAGWIYNRPRAFSLRLTMEF